MTGTREDTEAKLVAMITKWVSIMKWHPNYEKRLRGRVYQEDFQKERIRNLTEFLGDLSEKKILELGCGMGGLAVALEREMYEVIPVDFNMSKCQITRFRGQRYNMNVSPVNARGESLPFKEQLFDAACLFDVLEHVQSPEKVLNELFRVLKPGGSVMVTVINKYAFRDPHYHMRFINWMPKGIAEWYIKWRKREKDITICEDRQKLSDMNYFTFEEFRRVAKTTGFKLEDVSFLKINQPHLIRDGKLQKSAEVLKALGLNGLAYFSFRLLSHLCANNFEFILHKRLPRT